MSAKFIVKGNLGGEGAIKPETFDTEPEALERAAKLIDQYGSRVHVDVWLGESAGQPFRNMLWVSDWRKNKRQPSN